MMTVLQIHFRIVTDIVRTEQCIGIVAEHLKICRTTSFAFSIIIHHPDVTLHLNFLISAENIV